MKKQGMVISGKILVKQDEAETITKGGLIIPDLSQEKPQQGIVVIIGPSTERMKTLCEVGDRVFFSDHSGTPISMNDDDLDLHGVYLLMDYTGVLLYSK